MTQVVTELVIDARTAAAGAAMYDAAMKKAEAAANGLIATSNKAQAAIQRDTVSMTAGVGRQAAAWRALAAGADPVIKAQQQLEKATTSGAAAMALGKTTAEQYASVLGIYRARADAAAAAQGKGIATMTASTGAVALNAGQVQNLTFQLNDMATMLASGQSPFVMLMQQGMQMAQVFGPGVGVGGALKATGVALVSFLTNPLTLAVVGIAAAAGAVSLLWSAVSDSSSADRALEEHKALIDDIRDAYGEAGTAATSYAAKSAEVLQFRTADALTENQRALAKGLDDFQKMYEPIFGAILIDFGPLTPMVQEFTQAIRAGNADVAAFEQALAAVGNATDDVQTDAAVAEVLALIAPLLKLEEQARQTAGATQLFAGTLVTLGRAGTLRFADAFGDMESLRSDLTGFLDEQNRAAEEAAQAAKQRADAISGVVEQLTFEGEQLKRTAREQAIYNALKQAGTTLDTASGQKIADMAGRNFDLAASQDLVSDRLKAATSAATGFFNTFLGGLTSGKGLVSSLTSALGGLSSSLLNKGVSGIGDAIGGLFGGGGSDPWAGLRGGATGGAAAAGGGILSSLGSIAGPIGSLVAGIGGSLLSSLFSNEDAQREREERRAATKELRDLTKAIREMGQVGGDLTNLFRDLDDKMQQLQKAAKKADRDIGPAVDKINALKADAVRDFAASFDAVIASMRAGTGLSGPVVEGIQAVQALGAEIADFVKDAKKAGMDAREARLAGRAALVDSFMPAGYAPETNPLQTFRAEQERINGMFDAVVSELMATGLNFQKATAKALEGQADALAAAAEMYKDAIEKREAGYLDRLFAATNDASTLDGQLAAFDRQARQQRADEIAAGGELIKQLDAALAAERLNIIKDFNAKAAELEQQRLDAIAQRTEGYLDRLFAATNDSSTLAGALAEFDRDAARQRAEEARVGGQAMADLERALAAERFNVIKGFNEKALEEERSAARSRLDEARANLRSAYDAEASAINRTIDRLRGFVSELGEFRASLRLDQSLSILSPEKRYLEAQRQFRNMQLLASAGDEAAQAGLTRAAQSFLTESRSFNASNSKYASDFLEVERAIGNAAADAQNQLTIAEQQLVSLDRQVSELITINDSVLSVADAIRELRAAMGVAAGLGLNMGGMIPGFASGGMVGNGMWNRDSVLARYAGGGNIALSGGEYVTPAPSVTPATLPVLQHIRQTGQAPSIDVTPIVQAVIAASQAEMATTREEMEQLGRKFDNLSTTIRTSKNATPRPGGAKLQ